MRIEFTYAWPLETLRSHLAPDARRSLRLPLVGVLALALLWYAVVMYGDDIDGVTALWVSVVFAIPIGWVLVRAGRRYAEIMTVPPFWSLERRYMIDDDMFQVTRSSRRSPTIGCSSNARGSRRSHTPSTWSTTGSSGCRGLR